MESISRSRMQGLEVCILVISCLMGTLGSPHGLGVDDLGSGVRALLRTYSQCQRDEATLWPCLKQRALALVDGAVRQERITLVDGVSLERDAAAGPVQGAEEQLQLPQEPEARSQKLDDLLWDRATSFLQSHSLRIKLPSDLTIEEGRGKLKKLAGPILMALMMKKMLAALAIGGLALLAGKALLVSKLALALSLIVALKKLMGGGGGGGGSHETYEIVAKHPHHHEGSSSNHVATVAEPHAGYFGHRRSLSAATPPSAVPDLAADASSAPAYDVNNNNYSTEDFAQMMAYRAHKQAAPSSSAGAL